MMRIVDSSEHEAGDGFGVVVVGVAGDMGADGGVGRAGSKMFRFCLLGGVKRLPMDLAWA